MKTPIRSTPAGAPVDRNSSTDSQKVVEGAYRESDLERASRVAVRSVQSVPKDLPPDVEGVPLLAKEGELEQPKAELVAEPRREAHGVLSSREFEHGD